MTSTFAIRYGEQLMPLGDYDTNSGTVIADLSNMYSINQTLDAIGGNMSRFTLGPTYTRMREVKT